MNTNPLKTWWKARQWFKFPAVKVRFCKAKKWFSQPCKQWFYFESTDLMWKDKWNTPRHEHNPYIHIVFFGIFMGITFVGIDDDFFSDEYWEQLLWTTKYCDNDIVVAENTWPWRDEDKKSTWHHECLTARAKEEIFFYNLHKNRIKDKFREGRDRKRI